MTQAVDYTDKCFLVEGKRVFLRSGSIHYFRLPKQEWKTTLYQAKLAGMNCIDVYFAWNFHETSEGTWDFSGDRDCETFLKLCNELGLWVIARPGPYICAEWDMGGLPYYLSSLAGIEYRTTNAEFMRAVLRYFDEIIPLIARHQITAGGSVIFVQVENEYGHIAGDEEAIPYVTELRDAMCERGIQVPFIACEGAVPGAIEAANTWSDLDGKYTMLRAKQPGTPKIVTEFWTGWFEHWGSASAVQP